MEREIKARKQEFGIEIYDLMALVEADSDLTTEAKEAKIRAAFDQARKDIAVIEAKKECKVEEMAVLDAEAGMPGGGSDEIPPSDGQVLTTTHPDEMNTE